MKPIRLGVNIDHVATLRNARGGAHPDPLRAALSLAAGGDTDLITIHLREDRRHIRDDDVWAIRRECPLPLNLEMALTDEMLTIARDVKPDWVCLVPEKRQEITTEGGLAIAPIQSAIKDFVAKLQDAGINVSLFIDPDTDAVERARDVGVNAVELHTGAYAHSFTRHPRLDLGSSDTAALDSSFRWNDVELIRLRTAAALCEKLHMNCHAGHGLTFDTVAPIAAIPNMAELNIGHFLVGEALWMSLPQAVREMKRIMLTAHP